MKENNNTSEATCNENIVLCYVDMPTTNDKRASLIQVAPFEFSRQNDKRHVTSSTIKLCILSGLVKVPGTFGT